MPAPVSVLFLSRNTAARSQMAEALLRRLGDDRFDVHSAGFDPPPVARGAMQAGLEFGIDLAGQRSRHVNEYLNRQFDHVIVLCDHDRHFCPDFPHDKETSIWVCDAPTEAAGDDLQSLFENWLDGLWLTMEKESR